MIQKALNFFFENYDFKNFEATAADQGFVENHINSQYEKDERPTLRFVRRMVRELSNHPDIRADYMFDAGGHQGMWRRMEGFRINLFDMLLMKVTIEMGEDAGTYEPAQNAYIALTKALEKNAGKRYQVTVDSDGPTTETRDLDYAYLFSQVRNLVSQLSDKCVFKVEESHNGTSLTIMPLTKGLSEYSKQTAEGSEPESSGTFIKIQLRNA